MKPAPLIVSILAFALSTACERSPKPADMPPADPEVSETAVKSLREARKGFATKLLREERVGTAPAEPPPELFRLVRYPAPSGELAAYVSVPPQSGGKHPAIIWIAGGFSNSIGRNAWTPGPEENDQSATAFREAGVMMMYPSFRGGNDNPGAKEAFYGEVDDVLAAADYLAKLEHVDPQRIYLGGHSTGGTLALLAAESTDRFRAVFSFGPVEDVEGYGGESLPFDMADGRELALRAPGRWLSAIRTRTFVIEGASDGSNIESLRTMARLPHSEAVRFYAVAGADHFSTLQPITRLIARKIMADEGDTTNIDFTEAELSAAVKD